MCAVGCCSRSVLLLGRNYFCGFQFWNDGGHLNRVSCGEEGIISMTSKTVCMYACLCTCALFVRVCIVVCSLLLQLFLMPFLDEKALP